MPDERVTQEHLDAQAAVVAAARDAESPSLQDEFQKLHQMRKTSIGQAVLAGERPHTQLIIGGDAVRD